MGYVGSRIFYPYLLLGYGSFTFESSSPNVTLSDITSLNFTETWIDGGNAYPNGYTVTYNLSDAGSFSFTDTNGQFSNLSIGLEGRNGAFLNTLPEPVTDLTGLTRNYAYSFDVVTSGPFVLTQVDPAVAPEPATATMLGLATQGVILSKMWNRRYPA